MGSIQVGVWDDGAPHHCYGLFAGVAKPDARNKGQGSAHPPAIMSRGCCCCLHGLYSIKGRVLRTAYYSKFAASERSPPHSFAHPLTAPALPHTPARSQITVDGFSAPISAGNFVANVLDGAYNGRCAGCCPNCHVARPGLAVVAKLVSKFGGPVKSPMLVALRFALLLPTHVSLQIPLPWAQASPHCGRHLLLHHSCLACLHLQGAAGGGRRNHGAHPPFCPAQAPHPTRGVPPGRVCAHLPAPAGCAGASSPRHVAWPLPQPCT